jgi:LCP family protein required for cell wall assembly
LPKARKKSGADGALRWIAYSLFLLVVLAGGSIAGWVGRSKTLRIIGGDVIFGKDPKRGLRQQAHCDPAIAGLRRGSLLHGTYLHGSNIIRQYARTDMMLLTKLDFDNNKVTGISIPRDTRYAFPGESVHKINAFFSFAPVDKKSPVPALAQRALLTQRAVEGLLPGVHVDQSIVLNFDAFQKLVDLVGGVDINVPEKMDYVDKAGELFIHLKPGPQHMNGYQAMGYVRFRHDIESDFGRQARQKDFMLAFKKSVIGNLSKLPDVVDSGKQVLNGSLSDEQIGALFAFVRKVPQQNIQMGMVPVLEKSGGRIVLDKGKVGATLQQFGFATG